VVADTVGMERRAPLVVCTGELDLLLGFRVLMNRMVGLSSWGHPAIMSCFMYGLVVGLHWI
jgi:hypothetical protein